MSLFPAMVGCRVLALEERYGAKLVERATRSLHLTPLGEQFLARAGQILEAADELAELTRSDRGCLSGRIRVDGPTTLCVRWLAGIVSSHVDAHPALAIKLNLSGRNVDLIADGYDLAVATCARRR